jgi:hypothetical protein
VNEKTIPQCGDCVDAKQAVDGRSAGLTAAIRGKDEKREIGLIGNMIRTTPLRSQVESNRQNLVVTKNKNAIQIIEPEILARLWVILSAQIDSRPSR